MIILTGGAGFIGSCFLKFLNDKGFRDIMVVDNLASSLKWKNLVGKKFKDYVNKKDFLKNIEQNSYTKIDAIFHFGACSSTTEANIEYLMENNFKYSVALAEFAVSNSIPFIYASSAATYGDGSFGYSDFEFEKLQPLNGYGFSKHLFDLWVIENEYDKIFTGIKFFNVFGPNEYHKGDMASMVYKSFNQITATGKIKLFKSYNQKYADGEQLRDFIYIKDINKILWKLYEKGIKGIYNLGTGNAHSWNELAKAVFSAMKITPNIEYIDMPMHLIGQYQYYTQADMQKLSNTGIYLQFTSLEDSIYDYVNNHLIKNNIYY
jgi:ADP-L-glycero-D-manno-heptose 6-epimerase